MIRIGGQMIREENKKHQSVKALVLLAGETRIELATRGFGDRCSTN